MLLWWLFVACRGDGSGSDVSVGTDPSPTADTSAVDTAHTGVGTVGSGTTAETGPMDSGPVGPEEVLVLGTEAGLDDLCLFGLDPGLLTHRVITCFADGVDGEAPFVASHSRVRVVDGSHLVGFVLRGELDGTNYGATTDTVTGYDAVVVDIDAGSAQTLLRVVGEAGLPDATEIESIVVEAAGQAVVSTRLVGVNPRSPHLQRVGPTGSVDLPLPPGDVYLAMAADDGVLVTADGVLGRIDTVGTWAPITRDGYTAGLLDVLPDGRIAGREAEDNGSGKDLGPLFIAHLGTEPAVDARTEASWGDYVSVYQLQGRPDGQVGVLTEDRAEIWDGTDDGSTRTLQITDDNLRVFAVSSTNRTVVQTDGVLEYLDRPEDWPVITSCSAEDGRYGSAVWTPSGRRVVATVEGGSLAGLQACGPHGQPVDLTAATGLRGTLLAWP